MFKINDEVEVIAGKYKGVSGSITKVTELYVGNIIRIESKDGKIYELHDSLLEIKKKNVKLRALIRFYEKRGKVFNDKYNYNNLIEELPQLADDADFMIIILGFQSLLRASYLNSEIEKDVIDAFIQAIIDNGYLEGNDELMLHGFVHYYFRSGIE